MKTKITKSELVLQLMRAGEVPLLIGEAGVGKTAMIYQIAEKLKLDVIDLPLQLMEPEDFLGIPIITNGKTTFTSPAWFPDKPCVLFLDEINRASPRNRGALLKLLYEKKIGLVKLPEGTLLAAAMNPSTDDYEVDEIADQAMLSRLIPIEIQPSINEWTEYAVEHKIDKDIIDFLTAYPEWLLVSDGPLPRPNPRTWEKVSIIRQKISSEVQDEFFNTILNKMIGVKATIGFNKFLDGLKTFDPNLIFDAKQRSKLFNLKTDQQIIALNRAVDISIEENKDFVESFIALFDKLNKEVVVAIFRTLLSRSEKNENVKKILDQLIKSKYGIKLSEMITTI